MSSQEAIRPIYRDRDGTVVMLDQTRLPHEEVFQRYSDAILNSFWLSWTR